MSSSNHHTINGVRLYVDVQGEGEPLVLVHGSWDSRHTWAGVDRELAERYRVISYDRRGHTDSGDGPGPDRRRDDEDDLAALIESVAGGRAHVIGNSFGGSIALGLASRRPELFLSLAAHDPPLMALAGEEWAIGFGQAVEPVLRYVDAGDYSAAAAEFVGIVLGPGAWDGLPAEVRALLAANAPTFAGETQDPAWSDLDLDGLRELDAPLLVTYGEESPPPFPQVARSVAAAVDSAALRSIDGAGHAPHQTHPAEYVELVTEFGLVGEPSVGRL